MIATCCGIDVTPANLYNLGGERVCPGCMAKRHEREQADPDRFKPRPQAPAPEHGLVVEDVPRGMAGRMLAMHRRRSA